MIEATLAVDTAPTRTSRGPRHAPRKPRSQRGFKAWLRRWWWVFVVVPAAAVLLVLGMLVYVYAQLELPATPPPLQTTYIYDRHGNQIATLHAGVDRTIIPLSEMPRTLRRAVIAVEDQDFYRHPGIDPIGIVEILDLIRRLSRERGLTVLLSSHLLEQVQSVCDRVGIFLSGRLVARGTVAELARTAGTSAVTIEVATAGSPETIDTVAPRVAGVSAVEPDPADPRLRLVRAERDVRAELAAALVAAGWPPIRLDLREEGLVAVYRRFALAESERREGPERPTPARPPRAPAEPPVGERPRPRPRVHGLARRKGGHDDRAR